MTQKSIVVEQHVRLSHSSVWQHYRSNRSNKLSPARSSRAAKACASMLLAAFKDVYGPVVQGNRSLPVYVIDLNAGDEGAFSYKVLRHLLSMKDYLPRLNAADQFAIVYIVTDVSESNVQLCRRRECWRDLIEMKLVDFAVFDPQRDHDCVLQLSGTTLERGNIINPLLVVANHVFGSMRQDAFCCIENKFMERLLSLIVPAGEFVASGPAFCRSRVSWKHLPASQEYYSGDLGRDLNSVLDGLLSLDRIAESSSFMIPIGAIRALRSLLRISSGRMCLLLSDNLICDHSELIGLDLPSTSPLKDEKWASDINLPALSAYIELKGGRVLAPRYRTPRSNSLLVTFGSTFPQARMSFSKEFQLTMSDAAVIARLAVESPAPSLAQATSALRLMEHDMETFLAIEPKLSTVLSTMPLSRLIRNDLLADLNQVWSLYYPSMGEGERDAAFVAGRLFFSLEDYQSAMKCFRLSLRVFGETDHAYFNLALSLRSFGDTASALVALQRCLDVNPNHARAQEMESAWPIPPAESAFSYITK